MKDFFEMTSTCIQGGYPRTLGGFQTPKLGPHSPPMAWQYPPVIQNQQVQATRSEERNDSGINSGSDCHSSSPGSENGTETYSSPDNNNSDRKVAYYSTPILPRNSAFHSSNMVASPPSNLLYPNISVKSEPEDYDEDSDVTLTNNENQTDALKRLEMSVEKNLNLSVASPGISENSMDDKSENHEEFDENGHKIPRINSHGKIKTFKCKQCAFVAITKFDFWEHQRQHIRPEKLLTCHKCPFVTEYKHHLEYHLRNHDGSKPFKCEHCDYTCVNKSMLNSHKKSHSNIYQYRCAECHYASKYCHSLKLHLRKYNHQPAMVLNPDGSPNPLPIIDVYGTRRGPKVKPLNLDEDETVPQAPKPKRARTESNSTPPPAPPSMNIHSAAQSTPPMLPLPLQQLMNQAPPMQVQVPLAYSWLQQAMIYQNLERLARENQNLSSEEQEDERPTTDSSGALDLTKDNSGRNPNPNTHSNSEDDHVLKLDTPSTSSDEEDNTSTTMFSNVEVVQDEPKEDAEEARAEKMEKSSDESKSSASFSCQYCSISFGDAVLYTMHMGYHGYQDPFACNMCGEKCKDKVSFFLHIARTSHS